MRIIRDLLERARSLFHRRSEEAELSDEIRFHMDMETEKLVRSGMSPEEARRRAGMSFGGAERISEEFRDARGVRPVEDFARDMKHAFRSLARRPGFAAVAVLTMAIGIGASTAMFTLVDSVLLKPLSHPEPERMAALYEIPPRGTLDKVYTSPHNLTRWRERFTVVEHLAGFTDRPYNLTGDGDPAVVLTRYATPAYFDVYRVRPHLGRFWRDDDEEITVAVLSHALWTSRYGADPSVIGRTITVNNDRLEVIGVMPPDFHAFGGNPEVWAGPHVPERDFPGRYLRVVARLRPGASFASAQAELDVLTAQLAQEAPQFNTDYVARIVALHEEVTAKARPAMLLLLGAVSLVLLIACANVANLFLTRSTSRRREIAVRQSMGATRWRLLTHALAEPLAVSCIAGTLGVLLAWWTIGTLTTALPAELALPRMNEIALDRSVLAFAVLITLVTGALFAAPPALNAAGIDLASVLREGTRGSTAARSRLRSALVVGEVALAVMLLSGAGLLIRTIQNYMNVDPGLRAEGVLSMRITLESERYSDPAVRPRFMKELLTRFEAMPGVVSAGATAYLPLTGVKSATSAYRADQPPPPDGEQGSADIRVVAGDYFGTMGIPLLRGRLFDATDTQDAPARFIINETLAREMFPGEDPVGKSVAYWWGDPLIGEVIGVVGSIRELSLDEEPAPAIYRAYEQDPTWGSMSPVIRTSGDPAAVATAAAAIVRELDANLPVGQVRPFQRIVESTLARQRLSMVVLTGFAAVSLLLVIIGMYGVVSYSVAQRTREIGVRMAFGAGRMQVMRMVVGEGMLLTAGGLVLGAVGTLLLSRVMSGLLFGVQPTDPATIAAAAAALGVTGFVASFLPANRATRIDPAGALAAEG